MRLANLQKGLMLLLLILAGCASSNFIISKNERGYYLGSDSKILHDMLCKSGDMERALKSVNIPDELKKEFYKYTCTKERSRMKVRSLFTFFSPEEQEHLKDAFRGEGYTINYMPC